MGTWCQGCDAHGAGRAAEGSGKPALRGQQKGLEVELGGQGLRGAPCVGHRGAPMHAANPAVLREGGPGPPGGGGHKDLAAPRRPAWALWCVPPGSAMSL